MYPSSNYTSPYVSNFKPYRLSDVAHGSCTSAYADKIRGSPRPGKKSQGRLGQIFLQHAKCCHSKCTRRSHGLILILNFMQILTTIPQGYSCSNVKQPCTGRASEPAAAILPAGHCLNPNSPLDRGTVHLINHPARPIPYGERETPPRQSEPTEPTLATTQFSRSST